MWARSPGLVIFLFVGFDQALSSFGKLGLSAANTSTPKPEAHRGLFLHHAFVHFLARVACRHVCKSVCVCVVR